MAEATNPITTASNPLDGEDVGRELERLSAAAPAGEWYPDLCDAFDADDGPTEVACDSIVTYDGEDDAAGQIASCGHRVAEYVCALVNAHRSGKLVASTGSGEETKGADPYLTETTEALVARLEAELGVKGINSVFRRALAIAKEASADAKLPNGLAGVVSDDVVREIDDGSKILAGLEDALAWAKGDKSRGKLITVKDGKIVEVQDGTPAERDHVVSARLIPWKPGSLGGVDLTFESGLRVALPLSEPEATPKSSPSQTPVDPQELSFGPGCYDFASSVASKVAALPWAWAETGDAQDDRYSDVQMIVDAELRSLAPSDAPSTTEADR